LPPDLAAAVLVSRAGRQYPHAVLKDEDERFAASRQPVTAASSAAGLNAFCRLRTAPSLVAMEIQA
jgi:hypothetical protein